MKQEIVSNKKIENVVKEMLYDTNAIGILKSIGQDSQSWQAKLQYLMDLDSMEREKIIDKYDVDGTNLIQDQLKKREEEFAAMERGYIEDAEYGIIDYDISEHTMLLAIFGITYDDAKELIKKYGADIDKLDIQSEDEKRILRKLQIMKELTSPGIFKSIEELEDYYYKHKGRTLHLSD